MFTNSGIYDHACAGHGIHRGPAIDDKEKILSDGYDMGEIDVMEVKMDLMEVMKENKTSMPQGLTMLERHVVIGL